MVDTFNAWPTSTPTTLIEGYLSRGLPCKVLGQIRAQLSDEELLSRRLIRLGVAALLKGKENRVRSQMTTGGGWLIS
ncbi:hypothetical protein ACOMHN_043963 [Nucella lapillus]